MPQQSTYPRSLATRLWEKIAFGDPDECWPFLGTRDRKGYGSLWVRPADRPLGRRGQACLATRAVWYLIHGVWPTDDVLHTCDNPPCCNPLHLYEGTEADNHADMLARGRQQRGERNGNSRLTAADVLVIRARAAAGELYHPIAADYGISVPNVSMIVNRHSWKHL